MKETKKVSFPYKGEMLEGTIKRLNKKTVTVETDSHTFRVPYQLTTPRLKPPRLQSNTSKGKKWTSSQSSDYQKSLNSVIEPLTNSRMKVLQIAVKLLGEALKNGDEEAIKEITNETIAELNLIYNLPPLKVYTGGKRRMTRGGQGQYYGVYRLKGEGENRHSISVYSRTAKSQKIVAPKTFLRTLLHEWGHHYDKYKLNLKSTFHTKGFYDRVNTIYGQLKEPLN
ncbi:MAG: hypothetical protein ACXABK_05930 [Candidatus Heimdallarchaeaceae archaeon]|jgi:hypothetical protein